MADDSVDLSSLGSNLLDFLTSGGNPGGDAMQFLDTLTGQVVSAQDIADMGLADELPSQQVDLPQFSQAEIDATNAATSPEQALSAGLSESGGGGGSGSSWLRALGKGLGGLASLLGGAGGAAGRGAGDNPLLSQPIPPMVSVPGFGLTTAPMSTAGIPAGTGIGLAPLLSAAYPQGFAVPGVPEAAAPAGQSPGMPPTPGLPGLSIPTVSGAPGGLTMGPPMPLDLSALLMGSGGGSSMPAQRMTGLQRLLQESRG